MKRITMISLAGVLGIGLLVTSPDVAPAQVKGMQPDAAAADLRDAPPGGAYKKVSALVALPDFIPGLGTLYVDPATLPAGPFLAYDRDGSLVSSIYMIPLKDMNDRKAFNDLKVAREPVDHVDVVFNAGHPGVAEPHYHVILWYVSAQQAAQLAQ